MKCVSAFLAVIFLYGIVAGHAQPKQTGAGPKLLAQCYYISMDGGLNGGEWRLQDSVAFFYPPNRQIQFDYNQMSFTDAFSPALATDFLWLEPVPNNLDSGAYPRFPFDSLHHYSPNISLNNLYISHSEYRRYNSDSLVERIWCYDFDPSGDTLGGYNQTIGYQAGHFTDINTSYRDTLGNWQTYGRRKLSYNAIGKPLTDTLYWLDTAGMVSPYWFNLYQYNSTGKCVEKRNQQTTTSDPDQFSVTHCRYTPMGQLSNASYGYGSTNAWIYHEVDSFSYQIGVPGYHDCIVKSFVTAEMYHVNTLITTANTLKDSVACYFGYGTGECEWSYKMKYNSLKHPVAMKVYKGIHGRYMDDYLLRWYYEGPTSVPQVTKEGSGASWVLVPNPGQDIFTLIPPDKKLVQDLICRVTNMSGSNVPARLLKTGDTYQLQLDGAVAAGHYVVTLLSRDGSVRFRGQLVKN